MIKRVYIEAKKEKLPIHKCVCGGSRVRSGVQWLCQSPEHDARMAQLGANKAPAGTGKAAPQAQLG